MHARDYFSCQLSDIGRTDLNVAGIENIFPLFLSLAEGFSVERTRNAAVRTRKRRRFYVSFWEQASNDWLTFLIPTVNWLNAALIYPARTGSSF